MHVRHVEQYGIVLALLLPTPDDRATGAALAAAGRRPSPPTEAVLFPLAVGREEHTGTSLSLSRRFATPHPKTHSGTTTLRSPYPTLTQGRATAAAHKHQPNPHPLSDAHPPHHDLPRQHLPYVLPPPRPCFLPPTPTPQECRPISTLVHVFSCNRCTQRPNNSKTRTKKSGQQAKSNTSMPHNAGRPTKTHMKTRTDSKRTRLLPLLSTAMSHAAAAALAASNFHGTGSGRSGSKHVHEHHKMME